MKTPKKPKTPRISPEESVATFGGEVRELRRARQMTLADLAEASGVSLSHLSAIERGSVNPSLKKIPASPQGLACRKNGSLAGAKASAR